METHPAADLFPLMTRHPIDIETLAQWAIAHHGPLLWRRDREAELSLNEGLTVRFRRRPKASWFMAFITAGISHKGRMLPDRRVATGDAGLVIEMIKRLPALQASLVSHHARLKTRPDWRAGERPAITPKRDALGEIVIRDRIGGRRNLKRVDPYCPIVYSAECGAICQAREDYTLWHRGLNTLRDRLTSCLQRWEINGFAAEPYPWYVADKETT